MKPKTWLVSSVFVVLSTLTILFTNMSSPGGIAGKIEGLEIEGSDYWVYGWVCQLNISNSLNIHFYAGGPYGKGGKHVFNGYAEYVAEAEVTDKCGSTAESKFRFKIKIPSQVIQTYQNQGLYAHGIRAVVNGPNDLIENSGTYRLPMPLATNRRGCMPSAINTKESRNTYMSDYMQAQNSPWIYTAWVWRETPDAGTNHSLSVARTKDFINWENTCGQKLTLPITTNSKTVVDPVLQFSGIMNNVKVGFDAKAHPIISYQKHKYIFSKTALPIATTQLYSARLDDQGVWQIDQMTKWDTKSQQTGGGSLSSSPYSPGFGGVGIDRNGVIYQTIAQPTADTTGSPASGTWKIVEVNGHLQYSTEAYDPNQAPVDSFAPRSGIPSYRYSLRARDDHWQTEFKKRAIRTTADEQWQILRGDWNGQHSQMGGLFDRKTRKFILHDETKDINFSFGPGDVPLWPVVADWNNDGKDSIGVYDSVKNKLAGKNTLEGGNSEPVSVLKSPLKDGHALKWYSINPNLTHVLTYEALPANNDLPFDCNGVPFRENNAAAKEAAVKVVQECPEKFYSPLVLKVYDSAKNKWQDIPIEDNIWGVGGVIAFKVIRGFQIMAYYDKDRHTKVAIRDPNGYITKQVLENTFGGWDSHNYITLTVDENLDIHLAADQHVNPMHYWRSTGLAANFKALSQTGEAELKVTYPAFFRTPQGELLFQYRDGASGDGSWIFNKYNIRTKQWKRFLPVEIFGRE